jgi:sugar lactone lactonase YvrE
VCVLLIALQFAAVGKFARAADPTYVFDHLAGSVGGAGSADGLGVNARFASPSGIAVDPAGNVFVADSANNTVRRISASGAVTTIAGSPGQRGNNDGVGAAARFSNPYGVAVDQVGNLYVSDQFNHTIRKITPGGSVTTLAGMAGVAGDQEGSGTQALFNFPAGIAVASDGTLLVADWNNHKIRRVTPAGAVSTLSGVSYLPGSADGTLRDARFFGPLGVALDAAGNLYVAEGFNCTIRKITTAGAVTTLAGTALHYGRQDGVGSAARFSGPSGVAVDSIGNVYVADSDNHNVRKITSNGTVTTIAGTGESGSADGAGSVAQFNRPLGIAVDSTGTLFVADTSNHTIRAISPSGMVTTVAGTAGGAGSTDASGARARFNGPWGVAVDSSGNTYVADRNNFTIRRVTPDGLVTTVAGTAGLSGGADGNRTTARFGAPSAVAVDRNGDLYVADTAAATIRKVAPNGDVTTLAGRQGQQGSVDGTGTDARFYQPCGVAVDDSGNVYVADQNCTIRKITPSGVVTTLAGAHQQSMVVDGPGGTARFIRPKALAVDGEGTVYVADTYGWIRKITPAGTVSTLRSAGLPWWDPDGIAVDSAGNVIVTDVENHVIHLGTASGSVTTIGGIAGQSGNADGVGSAALFTSPRGVAVDATGTLYIADSDANAIRRGWLVRTGSASHLANISARAYCSTGNSVTIGGFVVTGNTRKRVLIRAVGPTLTTQGIGQNEVLLDPTVEVHHGGAIVARNDDWGTNENASEIPVVAATIGATALAAGDTRSSALLTTLEPGVYTFLVKGKNDTSGIVLLEVYDADAVVTDSKFVNIAARGFATTGNAVAIGGFVISGNVSKRVLLRAVGPTLATQGIAQNEVLLDPTIELHHGSDPTIENDNWGSNTNQAEIVATGARVGATPIAATDTTSSALLLTLNPGVYSFIAKGRNDTSGIVLVEVYDAD